MQSNLQFVVGGGLNLTTSASEATKTVRAGETYRLSCITAACVVRFHNSTAVTTADGGFDFAMQPGESIYVQVPTGITTIRAIQVAAGGSLLIQRVDEGS
jgi:hypothetical protein